MKVQGSGFRVQGSGFRVQGSGFRDQGSGFRVQGAEGWCASLYSLSRIKRERTRYRKNAVKKSGVPSAKRVELGAHCDKVGGPALQECL